MSKAPVNRDPFLPVTPKGRGAALGLALLAHALLIAALAYGVHWRNTEPTPMAAELWAAVPQAAAPRAVEPAAEPLPPTPAEVVRAPIPAPAPLPPTPARPAAPPVPPARPAPAPLPDPQIAIEQAKKRAAAKREQAEDEAREAARQADLAAKRAQDKARAKDAQKDAQKAAEAAEAASRKADRSAAERKKAAQAQAEAAASQAALQAARAQAQAQAQALAAQTARDAKAEDARLASARESNLKRIAGLAGATGGATDTGSAMRSGAPSASYAGRIMARIKPNIVFSDSIDGNPLASVEVRLAPDGTIIAKRLVKSSGVRAWDEAVLRAIERTEVLPRDIDGRVPGPFQIDFKFRD